MVAEVIAQVRSTISYMIRLGCLLHFVTSNIYEFKITHGESMLPTLNSKNDFVHTLKRFKYGTDVQIGDVIVLVKPTDPDQIVCKRITGMPGDTVIIDPSNDSVDETKRQNSFDKYITIPEGHVWVTGDNLPYSLDSRTYSALPMALIRGKVVAANDFNDSYKSKFGFRWIENNFKEVLGPLEQQTSPASTIK